MARIGQLVLQNGRWGDDQIIAEDWIRDSTTTKVQVRGDGRCGQQYGYFWWLAAYCNDAGSVPFALGQGNGGQRILVVPDLDLVVVTTAGFYNSNDSAARLVTEAVVSALSR